MIDPQTHQEPHRRSGVSLSTLFVDEHVARAAISIPPEMNEGFAPVLLKYRDRVTSLYHNDRGRRHGRNENEKTLVSQRKPRLFDSRGERIRTFDTLVPKQSLPNAKNL
jgi:hypothetical protein